MVAQIDPDRAQSPLRGALQVAARPVTGT